MKNVLCKAKTLAQDTNWLSNVKELKELAKKASQGSFEKLPMLDLRKMGGSLDNPEVLVCKALSNIRALKTKNMENEAYIVDLEVYGASTELKSYVTENGKKIESPAVFPAKYTIWLSTTVLRNELVKYADGKIEDGAIVDFGVLQGKEFVISSYGTQPSKKGKKEVFLFKVFDKP
ncbi:MAG: hypothetical protein NWE98_02120 [Candidatus Bathyarchaeota archaeon]|nr:hypothetical protein [Candidatus Bathyarchaeota archaeon]